MRVPSATQPLVNPQTGLITPEWMRLFAVQQAEAGKITHPAITASPYAFTANATGHLLVTGGTVASLSLSRARVTVATGLTSGFVPMSAGDVVTITYSVSPTVSFIPE